MLLITLVLATTQQYTSLEKSTILLCSTVIAVHTCLSHQVQILLHLSQSLKPLKSSGSTLHQQLVNV